MRRRGCGRATGSVRAIGSNPIALQGHSHRSRRRTSVQVAFRSHQCQGRESRQSDQRPDLPFPHRINFFLGHLGGRPPVQSRWPPQEGPLNNTLQRRQVPADSDANIRWRNRASAVSAQSEQLNFRKSSRTPPRGLRNFELDSGVRVHCEFMLLQKPPESSSKSLAYCRPNRLSWFRQGMIGSPRRAPHGQDRRRRQKAASGPLWPACGRPGPEVVKRPSFACGAGAPPEVPGGGTTFGSPVLGAGFSMVGSTSFGWMTPFDRFSFSLRFSPGAELSGTAGVGSGLRGA